MLPRAISYVGDRIGGRPAEPSMAARRAEMDRTHCSAVGGAWTETAALPLGASEWVRPAAAEVTGAILYLHGSGYSKGSPASHRRLVSAIVAATGVPALVADYRLTPEHRFPAALEDALTAYRFLLKTVASKRIALVGDSAGGGLTLALLHAARDAGLPMPSAAVTLSAWTDLAVAGEPPADADDPVVTPEMLRKAAALYLDGADPRDPYASPLYGSFEGFPPLLMQVGRREIMRIDTMGVAEKARTAGVPVEVQIYDGMTHVFQLNAAETEAAGEAIAAISAFVRGRLGLDRPEAGGG